MKKIFLFISIFALTVGLIGYVFQLNDYDIFAQFTKIGQLDFNNPILDLQDLISQANSLFDFGSEDISWYEYIPRFFEWIGAILSFPIILIKDIALNIFYGLQAILYLLGFNF